MTPIECIVVAGSARSIHVVQWVNALARRGIKVTLFSIDEPAQDVITDSVEIVCPRFWRIVAKPLRYVLAAFFLRRTLRRLPNTALLHAHYASGYGLCGALAGFRPFIVSVWGADVYDLPHRSFFYGATVQFVLSRADIITSTSDCMADWTRTYTSTPVRTVGFGVDVQSFDIATAENAHTSSTFVFGTAKSLRAKYGHDVALRALALARQQIADIDLRLRIAGEGDQKDNLNELAQHLGLSDSVDFLGNLPHDKMPSFIHSTDCGLYLSVEDSESFGVSVVETLACARPVIVSDAPGFVEIVHNNGVGIVVPRRSETATADAMVHMARNAALCRSFGNAGRQHVQNKYTIPKCVDNMLDVYVTTRDRS